MYDNYTTFLNSVKSLANANLGETNNFIAVSTINKTLIEKYSFEPEVANIISVKMEVSIGDQYSKTQVETLAEAVAGAINNVVAAFKRDGFCDQAIIEIAAQFSLTLD